MKIKGELMLLLQDFNVRVSMYIKHGLQDHLGRLVVGVRGNVGEGKLIWSVIYNDFPAV